MNTVSTETKKAITLHGKCIIFAWGPPWTWLPSIQRSRWGLYWVPYPVAVLLIGGTLYKERLKKEAEGA